jgi:hypothetical protein
VARGPSLSTGDSEFTGPAVGLALQEAELARRLRARRAEGIALTVAGAAARGTRGIGLLGQAQATLAGTPCALEQARALAELGATLRRERQRAAAREPLRRALGLVTRLGATPLATRALDELRPPVHTPAGKRREASTASPRRSSASANSPPRD